MVLFPNAKINLGLDILSVLPNGYHEIETLMVPIGWCDILEIVPSMTAATTLHLSGREVKCDQNDNLVFKAYNAFSKRLPLPPVDIYLRKIIPDGAGLGGGSSDAASTLVALNRLFDAALPDYVLCEIASEIGADCPFFIYNKPMIAQGIGTDLSPFPSLGFDGWIVVAKPEGSVSTAAAYREVNPHRPSRSLSERLNSCFSPNPESGIIDDTLVTNAFEPGVSRQVSDVSAIKRRLIDHGALYSSLSGSGSAVYGLFTDDNLADAAFRSLRLSFDAYKGSIKF